MHTKNFTYTLSSSSTTQSVYVTITLVSNLICFSSYTNINHFQKMTIRQATSPISGIRRFQKNYDESKKTLFINPSVTAPF